MPTREEYETKAKNYYDQDGLLIEYPTKRPVREIVLERIAEKFESNHEYTEKEVNEIIKAQIAFTDVELIRRELFQAKYIGRLRDGSKYWKEEKQ